MVSGLGPTCTDKIFSPVAEAGASASVSVPAVCPSAAESVAAPLELPPQAVKPRTMAAVRTSASALFFIILPPIINNNSYIVTIFSYTCQYDGRRQNVLFRSLSTREQPQHRFHPHRDIWYGTGILKGDLKDLEHLLQARYVCFPWPFPGRQ